MNDTRPALIYPVFLPMQGCPGRCIYCDQRVISGVSAFDRQTALSEVTQFIRRNPGRRKQIAFYGGTFTALEYELRQSIMDQFGAVADEDTDFRISTHPAAIDAGILDWCHEQRIRVIELGIQDFDDTMLKAAGRDYGTETAVKAVTMCKEAGFETGVQLMPGLPGWSDASLARNHQALADLRPHLLRVYPCVVLRGTALASTFERGEYLPLTLDEAIAQCADYSLLAQRHGIRLIKLGMPSNPLPEDIVGGPWHPAFGELVKAELLVRRLQERHSPGDRIRLSKNDFALLKAHGLYYLKILGKRIENCSVYS